MAELEPWVREHTRAAYLRIIQAIAEHPDPGVREVAARNWERVEELIIAEITRQLVQVLRERQQVEHLQ
jgi:hypothetical protein